MWSWLTLNYAYHRLVAMLATMMEVAQPDAEAALANMLRKWLRYGLIEIQEAADG